MLILILENFDRSMLITQTASSEFFHHLFSESKPEGTTCISLGFDLEVWSLLVLNHVVIFLWLLYHSNSFLYIDLFIFLSLLLSIIYIFFLIVFQSLGVNQCMMISATIIRFYFENRFEDCWDCLNFNNMFENYVCLLCMNCFSSTWIFIWIIFWLLNIGFSNTSQMIWHCNSMVAASPIKFFIFKTNIKVIQPTVHLEFSFHKNS